ncbi:hypothetical protein SUGI_0523180 [Cryptomeria japonica]|nr:hypothetical protein SUGI_0523180 [Cryptomeria japonica]
MSENKSGTSIKRNLKLPADSRQKNHIYRVVRAKLVQAGYPASREISNFRQIADRKIIFIVLYVPNLYRQVILWSDTEQVLHDPS